MESQRLISPLAWSRVMLRGKGCEQIKTQIRDVTQHDTRPIQGLLCNDLHILSEQPHTEQLVLPRAHLASTYVIARISVCSKWVCELRAATPRKDNHRLQAFVAAFLKHALGFKTDPEILGATSLFFNSIAQQAR